MLSLALGESTDALIILGILLASGSLGFWQEHRASTAVEALLALIKTRATVLRDGVPVEVPLEDVVPGDVVFLEAGSQVPGDARLIEARDLFVDEALLTGESFPTEKSLHAVEPDVPLPERTTSVFQGTHVISGTARAVVVLTGAQTLVGQISDTLASAPPVTAFEQGIRRFGFLLIEVAVALALVIFAINVALDRPVLDALLFTLALTVGLTPQLLPAIMSVTLSRGAMRMARKKVIVRRLAAIEDIGEIDVLWTDKTGTLTEATVRVEGAVRLDGSPSDKALRYAYLNASFESGYANPIDDALRALQRDDVDGYAKVDEVPYDFQRKRLSVAVSRSEERLLITKGAVTNVLEICSSVETEDGVEALDLHRATIDEQYERLSRQGYRCLAVAYRDVPVSGPVDRSDEHGMTFLGLLLLLDPPKGDAASSLASLRELGVQAKVITGDNRHVAARIARDVGIDAQSILTGDAIRRLGDAALVHRAARTSVFAEVEPNQKERIIRALRTGGAVVGYLGDGINDAAALHAADVGISVDSAVDVTKQAADIVLLEKELGALVDGVREGRGAFGNTLKYVFITTSANFGNMFSMAAASLFAPFLPMLPKQILLLNALSDLPAMGISTDRLDPELVDQPRRWSMSGIARFMAVFGLISSIFDFATFGTLLLLSVPADVFRTAWFIESVLSELLILLVIRTRRPFYRSRIGPVLLGTSLAVAAAVLSLPFTPLATPLGFAPVPVVILVLLGIILAAYVAVSEVTKHVFFRRIAL